MLEQDGGRRKVCMPCAGSNVDDTRFLTHVTERCHVGKVDDHVFLDQSLLETHHQVRATTYKPLS